tara:strand:+ start:879 stop:1901 length:1023 start_codon:yes stop_codon:yes gene_type:complete
MKMRFEKLWEELEIESANSGGAGILKRMLGSESACPMFLGIKMPDLTKVFILQVPKNVAPLPENIPESKGFSFDVRVVGDERYSGNVSLILSSSNTDYNEVFSSISEDLFPKLNGLENKREVVCTFLNRVRLWQTFCEIQNPEGLGEDAQKGLYGELFFLDSYVLVGDSGYEPKVNTWLGPRNRQHDFQFGSTVVEVKTTSLKQHQKLQIASEQQLDETLVDRLYLFYLSVSLIENNDDTLPALVSKIRRKLHQEIAARGVFDNALIERGYLDTHESKYSRTGYSIRDSKIFLIADDFPRIKEEELRNGVGDVKYSILVAECSDYEMPESDFVKELAETF